MNDVHPCNHLRYAIEAKGLIDKYKSEIEAQKNELIMVLKDIRDHSGMPGFNDTKWSNYCHEVAYKTIKKYEEMGK